jgi:hypothetical protein
MLTLLPLSRPLLALAAVDEWVVLCLVLTPEIPIITAAVFAHVQASKLQVWLLLLL